MKYSSEFLLALFFHLLLVFFFAFSFTLKPEIVKEKSKVAIQAVIIDNEAIEQQIQAYNKEKKQVIISQSLALPEIDGAAQQRKLQEENAKKLVQQEADKAKQELARLAIIEKEQQQLQRVEELRVAEIERQEQIEKEQEALKEELKVIEEEVALLVAKEKKEADRKIAEAKHQQALAEQIEHKKAVEIKKQQALEKAAIVKKKKHQQDLAIETARKEAARKETARLAKIKQEKESKLAKKKESQDLAKKKQRLKDSIAADMASRQQQGTEESDDRTSQVAEAGKIKAQQDISKFTIELQRKLRAIWVRPISMIQGLSCVIRVQLMSNGHVIEAKVINGGSGDTLFDNSALNAVYKASPLPIPSDKALFEENFKSFTFTFKPE